MALGVRGSNPIWSMVDLAGKQADDSFYMWVLSNEIPYIPLNTFRDPDLNTIWTNPIQFLSNGTLPNNIYFQEGVVYRIEIRQNIGLAAPSQSDPLIYLIENYVANEGGSNPVDTIASTSSNQVTNPQFALVNFTGTYTISATDPDPIQVAPGWFLHLSGTGTASITQVPLNSSTPSSSNAPYALRLQLSGWTANSAYLYQRFQQNGMLWANKYVSNAVTAQIGSGGLPQSITGRIVDSDNTLSIDVLASVAVDSAQFNEFKNVAQLPPSENTNTPPEAYIEYRLILPSTTDIYVTSIQLVVEDLPVTPSFEQDSINRQIDHTYNTAYPIMPIGGLLDFAGFVIPDHYFFCNGDAKSRTLYQLLFNAITLQRTQTLTSGVNTFTDSSAFNLFYIGMAIEGNGIPASTTITNIVGTTVTMSNNATISGSSTVRFLPWGAGDGSTTFNLPELRGYTTAGYHNSLFYTSSPGDLSNGIGLKGGASKTTLLDANMPSGVGVASGAAGNVALNSGGVGTAYNHFIATVASGVTFSQGSATSINNIQPTALVNKIIRYE